MDRCMNDQEKYKGRASLHLQNFSPHIWSQLFKDSPRQPGLASLCGYGLHTCGCLRSRPKLRSRDVTFTSPYTLHPFSSFIYVIDFSEISARRTGPGHGHMNNSFISTVYVGALVGTRHHVLSRSILEVSSGWKTCPCFLTCSKPFISTWTTAEFHIMNLFLGSGWDLCTIDSLGGWHSMENIFVLLRNFCDVSMISHFMHEKVRFRGN